MVLTRKHIAVIIMIIFTAGIVFGGIKKYTSIQTFSPDSLKVVVDAGHRAFVKCFKVPKMSILSHFCATIDAGEGR